MTALMIVVHALPVVFKKVNEHCYHENVCLFAHLTVRLMLMIWMNMQMKVCYH